MCGWVLYETEILDRKGVSNKQASVFAREMHKQTNKQQKTNKHTQQNKHHRKPLNWGVLPSGIIYDINNHTTCRDDDAMNPVSSHHFRIYTGDI